MTKKQELALMFINYLVLAFVINSAATILNGGLGGATPATYLLGMFMAFSINFVAGIVIPVPKIGQAVAGGLGLKGIAHKLVRIFVINAIFVTIISFCIALINVGPIPQVFSIWFSTYPILHIVGLVTSIFMEDGCIAMAKMFD